MAAPTIQSSTTGTLAAGTALVINKPSGVATGDLLIAFVTFNGAPTITPPSGWTQVGSTVTDGFSACRSQCWRRIADGSEGADFTWSRNASGDGAGGIARITGFDSTTPVNASASNSETSGTAPTAPTVTTTVNDCLILHYCGGDSPSNDTTVPGPDTPVWYAESATNATTCLGSTTQPTAGATGTADFTLAAANQSTLYTVAIAPVAASGSVGTLSLTLGAATVSADATSGTPGTALGSATPTLGAVTVSADASAGTPAASVGAASATLGSVTLAGVADVEGPPPAVGTVSATLAGIGISASGVASAPGGSSAALSSTLAAATLSGAATAAAPGNASAGLSVTLGNVTLSADAGSGGSSMPVPQKPANAFRIPGHPFWALGCKGLLSAHEGTGTPQVIQANGAAASVTYTDGVTAGTVDPSWTTDPLSTTPSNVVELPDTARQIVATGCSAGVGMNAWTLWGTIRFDAANRNSVPLDLTPTNGNGIKVRLGTARKMYLYLWLNIRDFGPTLVDGNAYSFMATVKFNGAGDIDADLYLYDHDTATEYTPAHFDLTHGSVQQVDEAPIVNSRSVTGLTTSVGVDGKIWEIGWASNAAGNVGTLQNFRDYYADPSGTFRATLAASPTSLAPSTLGQSVTLTGNTAGWTPGTPGSPTFNLTATNATKDSQSVASTTSGTIVIDTGAAETLTITDAGTGATVEVPVSAAGATGYSLTGPTSGTVGVPSTDFTVALTGGTVPTPNPVTITPADGGGGGTFAPTSVQLSPSQTSGTFTYTAVSAGAKTISTTDDGSYADPAPITYTPTVGGLVSGSIVAGAPGRGTVTLTSTAPASGGQSPLTYSWEWSADYGGTYATISGQTGISLSGYAMPGYNVTRFFRRRVTDALAATAVTPVVPASTMPIETVGVLLIGSSSTAGMTGANIRTVMLSQSTGRFTDVIVTNQGVSGTETVHWLPPGHPNASGTQRLATALSAADTALAGSTLKVANVWIGVNDARTSERPTVTVMANIVDICQYLLDDAGYDLVVLPAFNYFIVPVAGTAAQLALAMDYNEALPGVLEGIGIERAFLGNMVWFSMETQNPAWISSDGIHNEAAGLRVLERLQAEGLVKGILQFAHPEAAGGTGPGGVIPAVQDVRLGVTVGTATGTLWVPAISDVRAGTDFDAGGGLTGTLVIPSQDDVRKNVPYGASAQYLGTVGLPAPGEVVLGVGYGANDAEFIGTVDATGFDGFSLSDRVMLTDLATKRGFRLGRDGMNEVLTELGIPLPDSVSLMFAALVGRRGPLGPNGESTFENPAGTYERIVGQANSDGSREIVTLNPYHNADVED